MGLRQGQKPSQQEKATALRGSQKGVSIVGKILAVLTPLMLLCIIGLSVAPVAALSSGWVYYRHDNIANNVANAPGGRMRILTGWYKGHNSAMTGHIKNSTISRTMIAVPATAVAFLLLSALTAFFYLLLSCCTTLGAKAKNSKIAKIGKGSTGVTQLLLTILAPFFGLLCIALAIAAYIVLAVFTASYARKNLGANYVGWPDWGFFLAVGAGLFWLLLAPLTALAAATSGASAGLDGQDVDTHQQGGQEHDQRELLASQQPKQQSNVPLKDMNQQTHVQDQNVNGANGYADRRVGNGGPGIGNHLENENGYVLDHQRSRGGLAAQNYADVV